MYLDIHSADNIYTWIKFKISRQTPGGKQDNTIHNRKYNTHKEHGD